MVRPFVPERVNGALWQDAPTEEIATHREFFAFEPGERWHGFDGYAKDQYFVDPNKLLLTTPGIDVATRRVRRLRDTGDDPRQLSARERDHPGEV